MPTLAEYRHDFAGQLGGFMVATATGGGLNSGVFPNAFKSTELTATNVPYVWGYRNDSAAPKQRRIQKAGLDPSTGTITFDGNFGSAFGVGSIVEFHTRIPAVREPITNDGLAMLLGCNECIVLALQHLLVEDSITVALTNAQQDLRITARWLDRKSRLIDVREPNVTGGTTRSSVRTWEFWPAVNANVIHFSAPYRFTSSGNVSLDVLRPADTIVAVSGGGGGYTDSTSGPTNDGDACWPEKKDVTTVALVFAYGALRDSRTGSAKSQYAAMYVDQLQLARKVRGYDRDNDIDPSVPQAAPAQAVA